MEMVPQFDFVHIRLLNSICPTMEWGKLYKQAYQNLAPGGWIDHINVRILFSDLSKSLIFRRLSLRSSAMKAQCQKTLIL